MGTVAKTITGQRAKLYINQKLAGIFTNVSYDISYDVQPIYIIGRSEAAELVYTGMNTVDVTATGFRVMDNGPYVIGALPQLQDILTHEDIQLTINDRNSASNAAFVVVNGVRPTGFSGSTAAKGLVDCTVKFMGTTFSDEAGVQADSTGVIYG